MGRGPRSRRTEWSRARGFTKAPGHGAVRQLIGYDRFASRAANRQLQRVYRLARLHVNFFQPVEKLVSKTRQGARSRRVYDRAQTPYQLSLSFRAPVWRTRRPPGPPRCVVADGTDQ
jgi:hypothetical protein